MKKILSIALLTTIFFSCSTLSQFTGGLTGGGGENVYVASNGTRLTNSDMVSGLMEALKLGINTASTNASKTDGFLKNPLITIPFPKEVDKIKTTLEATPFKPLIDDFVLKLNRAAESASTKAAPIFLEALKQMTINDALTILQAKDAAATKYLRDKTTAPLTNAFAPVINDALGQVGATTAWTSVTTAYNNIPFVEKVNTDIGAYTTEKALDGIYKLVAEEEMKIRKDPGAWGNNIIQNVFGAFLN